MAKKLIIDADPGIGDALAIALAAIDPNIDLIGVTATAGCVSGQIATHNILAVTETVDVSKTPRLGSSTNARPHVGDVSHLHYNDPTILNGNYGMGMTELPFAQLHNQHESAKVLVDLVRNHPHQVTLLTLGPLTNVERAMDLAPENQRGAFMGVWSLFQGIGSLVAPLIVGAVAERLGYPPAFQMVTAAVLLAALLMWVWGPETGGKRAARAATAAV